MALSFQLIIQKLIRSNTLQIGEQLNADQDLSLIAAKYLDQDFFPVDSLESDVLYVFDKAELISQFHQLPSEPIYSFLFIGSEKDFLRLSGFRINCCHIYGECVSFRRVLTLVSSIFMEEYRYERESQRLLQMLLANKDISYILDCVHQFLNCPIFAVDTSFKLIYTSGEQNIDDPIWQSLFSEKRFTYENIIRSKQDKRYTAMSTSASLLYVNVNRTPPAVDPGEVSYDVLNLKRTDLKYPRLSINIFQKRKIVMHIVFLEYGCTFSTYHFKMIGFLKNYIQNTLPAAEADTHPVKSNSILMDLITGNVSGMDELKDRLLIDGWILKKHFFVLCISGDHVQQQDLESLSETLEHYIPHSRSIAYRQNLIFLINHDNQRWNTDENCKKLELILKENRLYGGLSYIYNSIMDTACYFGHAQASVRLLIKYRLPSRVAGFDSLLALYFIDIAACQVSLTALCHPSLQNLMDFDKKKDSDYVKTLYVFLKNMTNYNTTAEQLHIHRNTLDYRIKRIIELTGLELGDASTVHTLLISYEILKITEDNRTLFDL